MSNLQDGPAGRNYLALSPNIADVVPAHLREMKRWTAWKFTPPKKAGGKPQKYPLAVTNDNATWKSFQEVVGTKTAGIGFMMQGATHLVGIDLDGCVEPATGAISAFATALLNALPETYAEVTPSRTGLRIFATVPEHLHVPEFLNHQHGVECYVGRSARFLTVTGHVLPGRAGKLSELTEDVAQMLRPFATKDDATQVEVEVEIKLPVPTLARLDVGAWQTVFDERLQYKGLKKPWRNYLEQGDLPGGRSERSFAIACRMLEARYHPDEVFTVLVSAPGSWEAALDKRDQDVTRARALIWADIGRAQKVVRSDEMAGQEKIDTWASLGLRTVHRERKVMVERSQLNAARIVTDHEDWHGRLALDVTNGRVLLDATPLDDYRFFELQEKVCTFANWEPGANRQWWADMLRAVAEKNPVNPRESELRRLKWDGTPRLDTWLTDYVTEQDTPLDRKLGRMWLLSCIARWIDPGCKVDTVLVLQGREGAGKNTLFEIIAGASDRVVPCDGLEKDDKHAIAEAWIAEMPEAGIFRRAERNRLKGFITQAVDRYRPPYAANPVTVRRGFVLTSTANPGPLFNSDQDGLRRWWIVQVREKIDYHGVERVRDQVLAEAVHAYDMRDITGEQWWFEESSPELRFRVEMAVESGVLDEAILTLIERQAGKGGLKLTEVMVELGSILGYRPNDHTLARALEKHDIRQKRTTAARFWIHPSWVRQGGMAADVIPLHTTKGAVTPKADEVLS